MLYRVKVLKGFAYVFGVISGAGEEDDAERTILKAQQAQRRSDGVTGEFPSLIQQWPFFSAATTQLKQPYTANLGVFTQK